MSANNYVNLHSHTSFSMLDGLGSVDDYMERAAELGMPALAQTDHGNLFGWLDFYEAGQRNGIKSILGIEAYLARKTRFDRDPEESTGPANEEFQQRGPYHITLLTQNHAGYKNLIKASSLAYLEGYFGYPRMDMELLSKHSEGVICLSGCLNGPVNQALLAGERDLALQKAAELQDIFGKENFFIEVMNHGIEEELAVLPDLVEIARKIDAKIVPTQDSHYVNKEDSDIHDMLLCVSTGSMVEEENRFRFRPEEFFLRSYEEMLERFNEPQWLRNTLDVAESIELSLDFGELHFPDPILPEGREVYEFFTEKVWEGIHYRYEDSPSDAVRERVEYEMRVIKEMGFPGYFIVVADIMEFCRNAGIMTGPGRGCLTGNVPIAMADGGFKPISEVSIGDSVITHEGNIKKVSNTFAYDVDEELYTIKSFYGDQQGVTLTGDHKVLVERAIETKDYQRKPAKYKKRWQEPNGDREWIPASEVKPGDWVYIPLVNREEYTPVYDLADSLLAPSVGRSVAIKEDCIIEKTKINQDYEFSLKDVHKKTKLAYGTLVRVGKSAIGEEESTIKQATLDRLSTFIEESPFGSAAEWYRYVTESQLKTVISPRFVSLDDNLALFLGMFASNGWLTRNKPEIGLATQASKDNGKVREVFIKCFGIEPNVYFSRTTDLVQYTITSHAVWCFLKSIFNEYEFNATTKHLPDGFLNWSTSAREALVDGLWWGDGSVSDRHSYSSSSKRLTEEVRHLLWSLNIPNSVSADVRTDDRKEWSNRATSYKIVASRDFGETEMGKQLKSGMQVKVRAIDIQRVKTKVYDLEVEDDHSFLTSSFVVHNSAAASAVSYAMQITQIEPLEYELPFERFLVPPSFHYDPVFEEIQ